MHNLTHKINLFGAQINPLTMLETVAQIQCWLVEQDKKCYNVITPNVDHIVKLQTDAQLKLAYEKAALVVTDGKPVRWAAKLLGELIPETVPGSDLVPAIFNNAQSNNIPLTVFLLGAMPGVADRAKIMIEQKWPAVSVTGTLSPDFGFEKNPQTCQDICDIINKSRSQLLVVGLGAPKQEIWVTKYAPLLQVNVALCVGATIDFIAGEKARAPKWLQNIGLEWLHRMLTEPRRLAKRYFHDALIFPGLIAKEWVLRNALNKSKKSTIIK